VNLAITCCGSLRGSGVGLVEQVAERDLATLEEPA